MPEITYVDINLMHSSEGIHNSTYPSESIAKFSANGLKGKRSINVCLSLPVKNWLVNFQLQLQRAFFGRKVKQLMKSNFEFHQK